MFYLLISESTDKIILLTFDGHTINTIKYELTPVFPTSLFLCSY